MSETNIVSVRGRNGGGTGYVIPELNVRRDFAPGEIKKISIDELKALSFVPGGEYILKNYLIVEDKDALSILNMEVEPEYYYTEADIKKLLFEGSLDQLEDTLNFAPEGAINLIKDLSVSLEIPDIRKRDLISKKTGFNINSAITIQHALEDDTTPKAEDNTPKRKAAPINAEGTPARKAAAPTYTITK